MKANVGLIDRSLRYGLGILLIWLGLFSGLAAFQSPAIAYLTAAFGVVMIIVATVRFCPFYAILGMKTCREC